MTKRILFVTTNGVGLGHLTRSMAIGKRLPADCTPVVLTLSQALPIVREQGVFAEFLHSAGTVGADRMDWQLLLEHRLGELCDTYDPAVVAFDGTSPYPGLVARVLADDARAWVWTRRGMWRAGLGADALALSPLFDAIVEPGDLAAAGDRGATARVREGVHRVDPVMLCDPADALDRRAARRELGLDPDAVCVLLQLGAGQLNDVDTLRGAAASVLRAKPGVQVAVAESTIAVSRATAEALPSDVVRVRVYPLQPLLAAFDVAVTAAGYNSVHELLAARTPAVFVPNRRTQLDDQVARAQHAVAIGAARLWDDPTPEGFERAVEPLLEASTREEMRAAAPGVGNGAGDAAAVLARLAREVR